MKYRVFRKICVTVGKVKVWGFSGVVSYIKRMAVSDRKIKSFFRNNARKYPCTSPEVGITIIGALSTRGSLCKTLRDFAFMLKDAEIPFQAYDTGNKDVSGAELEDIVTPINNFRICRYSHVVEMLASPLQDGIVDNRARIVFWEFNEGIENAFPCLVERDHSIIAMSDFNYSYLSKKFGERVNVFKVLYPLRLHIKNILPKLRSREKFGFDTTDFIVFYNFSYSSGWFRKNPEGVLRVFAEALGAVENAKLVFKTFSREGFEHRESELLKIAQELGVLNKVIFINDYLSQEDVYNLTNVCDVYLSMHRAEGFGLGIAEAMLLSKAVVVTNYSSITEFCTHENSMLVSYQLVDAVNAKQDCLWYTNVKKWAEPNLNEAVNQLKKLYLDEELRLRIGNLAKESIAKRYSTENFRESVLKFLNSDKNNN